MSWLDDHRAEALRTFRERFTDDEWAAFTRGECCVTVSYGTVAGIVMCGKSRRHNRLHCGAHVREAVARDPLAIEALTVPYTLSAIDLTDVP